MTGGRLWSDEFSAGNALGWTLDAGWGISSAATLTCGNGCDDPSIDHTSSSDNKIAGYIIGGCNSGSVDPSMLYLTSPVIDLGAATGTITLSFWRWFGLDYPGYMTSVLEVYDGVTWNTLWSNPSHPVGPDPCETSWSQYSYDITAFQTSSFQFRFGTQVTSSDVFLVGGMNIDDVEIWSSI